MVDMLIMRGARINVMNRGDDTPLHLAASHGHRDILGKVCTISMHAHMHARLYKVVQHILGKVLKVRIPKHPDIHT